MWRSADKKISLVLSKWCFVKQSMQRDYPGSKKQDNIQHSAEQQISITLVPTENDMVLQKWDE